MKFSLIYVVHDIMRIINIENSVRQQYKEMIYICVEEDEMVLGRHHILHKTAQ